MHTYTSYNPTVLNYIFKHIKAYVFLVPGHLFNTSWKEMLTKQNIEDGISCMSGCCPFPEIPFSHRVWKCSLPIQRHAHSGTT